MDDSHAQPATSTTAVKQHNTMRQAVTSTTTENVHKGGASSPTASILATALLLLLPLAR